MAKYRKFEELPVWQDAARLYNQVLDLLEQKNVPLSPHFVINWSALRSRYPTILPRALSV
jgi:hypothetical protein